MTGDNASSGTEQVGLKQPKVTGQPLGPHRVPRIECGNCGHEHHIDAASGDYRNHCVECSAFLREPTQAEEWKFTDFLVWNSRHLEREVDPR